MAMALALGLVAWESASQVVTTPQPVRAAWHIQKLTFTFQSKQSSYSCAAVGEKVWKTLFMLGARQDMHISVRGCDNADPLRGASPFGFSNIAPVTLRIELASPYEIDPVDRDGVTGERARRDLLRKTSGGPENLELAEQFPAFWSRVRISDLDHIEPGDCELVLQMQRQLFNKLNVRVVENHMSCLPGRRFRGEGLFEVETLLQARIEAQAAQ